MTVLTRVILTVLMLVFVGVSGPVVAQGTQVAFGNVQQDSNLPVEVTADQLSVDQANGTAIFTGNVLIGQGEMRLSAPWVRVIYLEDQSGIEQLEAKDGVTLVSGEDAAESQHARYNVQTGMITMDGNVLLVQGTSALTADRMLVDTQAGTARMDGRVKTVLQPESGE